MPLTMQKAELLDRQSLWNIVEKVENRKNSVLAREFEIAFPQELNAEQRQQLLDDLCKKIVERHNVIVDAVIHAPHTRVEVMNETIMLIFCLRADS